MIIKYSIKKDSCLSLPYMVERLNVEIDNRILIASFLTRKLALEYIDYRNIKGGK